MLPALHRWENVWLLTKVYLQLFAPWIAFSAWCVNNKYRFLSHPLFGLSLLYCQPRFPSLHNCPQQPYTCPWAAWPRWRCSSGWAVSWGAPWGGQLSLREPNGGIGGGAAALSPAPAQLNFPQLASPSCWERHQTELISVWQHPVALQARCLTRGCWGWACVGSVDAMWVQPCVGTSPGVHPGSVCNALCYNRHQDPTHGGEREK